MDRNGVLSVLGHAPWPHVVLVENQTERDIEHQILRKHRAATGDYDRIAYLFRGGGVRDISARIWKFLKKEVPFREESEDDQRTSAPYTILKRGWADCKGYALFTAGVLDALKRQGEKISWGFRFVCYKILCSEPSHVFVVVKDGDDEIWIDPVINSFDYHKPYWFARDQKVNTMSKVGSVECSDCSGAQVDGLVQTAGQLVSASAPALATIPVAGPFIAAGAALVGLFTGLLKDYKTSTGVRWLTQKYQYYVLGQGNVTSDNKVTEGYTDAAHKWFYAVFGVPVYDKFRYHTLTGTDPNTGRKLVPMPSAQQRASAYLQYPETRSVVTNEQALAAANIGTTFPSEQLAPGSWKYIPVSPTLASEMNSGAPTPTSQAASMLGMFGSFPAVVWIAIAIGAYLLLTSKN